MNTNSFKIEGDNLFIANKCVALPFPIAEVFEYKDLIVARVEPCTGVIFNRNIFAFTAHGNLLWQIEESPHGTEKDKPYTRIFLNNDGLLVAANWIGVDYLVNVKNGSISTISFNK
jgi:hypothetical protein